jgi:hypothetical protein
LEVGETKETDGSESERRREEDFENKVGGQAERAACQALMTESGVLSMIQVSSNN